MGIRTDWVVAAAALVAACFVWAPAGASEPTKIGVVDFQRCLAESQMGKRLKVEFKNVIADLKAEINKEEAALKALREDLEKQAMVLSETARSEKEKEYQQRFLAYNRKMEATQQEIRRKDLELTSKILEGLQPIIRDVGEKGGFTLILEKHEGGVLFAPRQLDVTEEVVRRYDESIRE